ncbi:MAG: YjfB family protein [Anaerolineaceae bacterium]
MNIPLVSLDSYMISQSGSLNSASVQNQIAISVMKQTMDSQQVMADALVEMISQPVPRIDGTGSIIDFAA